MEAQTNVPPSEVLREVGRDKFIEIKTNSGQLKMLEAMFLYSTQQVRPGTQSMLALWSGWWRERTNQYHSWFVLSSLDTGTSCLLTAHHHHHHQPEPLFLSLRLRPCRPHMNLAVNVRKRRHFGPMIQVMTTNYCISKIRLLVPTPLCDTLRQFINKRLQTIKCHIREINVQELAQIYQIHYYDHYFKSSMK